jgi:general secretion pathway protein G
MVVIIVLALLAALLLPAINGAVRTARNSAVQAEISLLSQALESFKAKYGDYPPSRFLAVESGNYAQYFSDTTTLQGGTLTDPTSPGQGDIRLGQLAQRSAAALRKLFSQVNTSGPPYGNPKGWYDFNGDGVNQGDVGYVLHGHECLVFFLGGVPLLDPTSQRLALTGFGKDPKNPFTNGLASDPNLNGKPNPMYSGNRQPPLFEFNTTRLFLDPNNPVGIPGYYDTLGSTEPGTGSLNFYAYFSAYGGGGYDPNDFNVIEMNNSNSGPGGPIGLRFQTSFPVLHTNGQLQPAVSAPPNPYTSTLSYNNPVGALPTGIATYHKPQTYQIISAGVDGLYGVGGQFQQLSGSTTAVTTALPFDAPNAVDIKAAGNTPEKDTLLRQREHDNLTNFKSGTLQ